MKTAMVVLVVLLATTLSPLTASAQSVRMSGGGGPSVVMRQPNGRIDTGSSMSGGGYRGSNRGSRGGYDNNRPRVYTQRSGGYRDSYDYNDDHGYHDNGRRNRSGLNIGLGGRIGGVRVNVGFNKTYSRPKPKPKPVVQHNTVVQKPSPDKCRLTLVREVGDKLETISPIVVTNPEKELVRGTSIVFDRNGEFFAEYSVLRVVGDTVFVEVIDAPRGNPRQGDSFSIDPAE